MQVKGTSPSLLVNTTLTGLAGTFSYNGVVDADPVEYGARGRATSKALDLRTLLEKNALPHTQLTAQYDLDLHGEALQTLAGSAAATLEPAARAGFHVDPSIARLPCAARVAPAAPAARQPSRPEADAARLRSRFNRECWSESRGQDVVALDGQKHQVDALTSNIGHLLWSGIVDPERAARTVERLMAPDMFSGWGVRTMSARDAGYNPIEYHNGTVWPHDTGLIAEGMRRYGFTREAATLAISIFDAAEAFAYRLPELFAGFPREETGVAVEYPSASRPQAWSAGAPLLALRTLLGLDVVDGVLHSQPHLPSQLGRLRLEGIRVRGGQQSAG